MKNLTYLLILFVGLILACQNEPTNDATATATDAQKDIQFNLPDGFVLEDLYSPNDKEQGSWVALTEGPNQLVYACDQYGDIYKFKLPAAGQLLDPSKVDSVQLEIGSAHGLLWAFNSLYVAVNKRWRDDEKYGSGIYRLKDTNGDGNLDNIEMLLKLDGAGEHGPHNFAVGPSGKDLYFLAGNHVQIPDVVKQNSRLPNNWGEDNVFPQFLDARGHANDIKAPGGWIVRMDPDGKEWDLISAGYRNPFDLAFNQDGELFTYDADMEWDIGMPWYRPTRICHVTSGSEFGWRTGSGKWPEYYPDNLPAAVNLEQGCPTGILMGNQLNFPAKYKQGMFIMDWSFGTIYYVDLKADGSTYTGDKVEFLSGTPLPLTDMIAGSDGNLYFATGGRRLQSHLYRLSYKGNDKGEAKLIKNDAAKDLRALRQSIEKFHTQKSTAGIALAWDNLGHSDRFIRYAARIALEHQPTNQWELRFFKEKNTDKIIQSGIALARQANKGMQDKILNKLLTIDWIQLSNQQKSDLIRAYNLLGIRMGMPSESNRQAIIQKISLHFPDANNAVNREVSQLLLFLKAPSATEKVVALLEKHTEEKTLISNNMISTEVADRSEQYGPLIKEVLEKMPPSEAIYYGLLLSHVEVGWTGSTREKYFQWFYEVMSAKGGLSFKPFMENVRLKAMSNVPASQKSHFEELSGVFSPIDAMDDLPEPIGPGKAYKLYDLNSLVRKATRDSLGNIANGKIAFQAAMCGACHRVGGEGGINGPDLTQIRTKFSGYDLAYAVFSPNHEISDQYAFTLFHLKDGKKTAGRILSETDTEITIMPNPYSSTYTVKLAKSDIEKQEQSPISPMPPGLFNRLNEQEITDLIAYLMVEERE